MVLQVRWKGEGGRVIDLGFFVDGNAPEKDAVVLIVLSKGGHRTSYCDSYIGGKK